MTISLIFLALVDLVMLAGAQIIPAWQGIWGVCFHFVLTITALSTWRHKTPAGLNFGTSLVAIGAAFGPIGVLAFSFLRPWNWSLGGSLRIAECRSNLVCAGKAFFEDDSSQLSRVLDGRLVLPPVDQVESLRMSLEHGDLRSRRKALETIVRSFEPRLSPLLAIALTDQDQTIRALAAAAAAQVNFDVSARTSELETSLRHHATDGSAQALAMHLADHGCHDVLLPQALRVHLCQASSTSLTEIEQKLPRRDKRRRKILVACREANHARVQLGLFSARQTERVREAIR